MRLFDRTSKVPSVGSFMMLNKEINCPVCGNNKFEIRDILLNTSGMTFLGLDWANKSATAMICTNCSRIEWYLKSPQIISE